MRILSRIPNNMKTPGTSVPFVPAGGICYMALAVLATFTSPSLAQSAPDAGGVLRETAPPQKVIPPSPEVVPGRAVPAKPTAAPGGTAVMVRAIRFSGNTLFSSEELQPLMAERIGQPNTLADLEALAMRVTEKYRAAGYMLAQAIVPVQDVTAGEIEISVIEGVLGRVRIEVDPAAPIKPAVVERIASRLKTGQPLHSRTLERVMLLLSDLPGITPQAALEQGEASGTSDVIIAVAPHRRWDFSLDADNHGSRSTGEHRIGAIGRINSPFGLGDNIDARVQIGSGSGLTYGRLGYELPIGGDGARLGLSYSRLDYALGKNFAPLDASGQADVIDFSVTYPLIRSRSRNLFGKFGWQQKWLDDEQRASGFVSAKRIHSLNAGLAYEARDLMFGGGYTSASLTLFLGDLEIEQDAVQEQDRLGPRTDGHFERLSYSVSRLNALAGRWNVFVGVTGQFARQNLDSAEKIALGGPRSVRAYSPSEATVDEGHVANLELRYSVLPELSLHGFYDWGWGRFNRHRFVDGEDNEVSLRGYGVGAFWGGPEGITLRTSLAWRATARGASEPDRVPRVYVQFSKAF